LGDDALRGLERERALLLETLAPEARARVEEIDAIGRELAALPQPSRVYAAAGDFVPNGHFAPPKGPRPVQVLARGDVKKPLRPARPGGVAAVPSGAFGAVGAGEGERRAALARWLTDPSNILLRRSIVNRVWALHFGRGIVDTPNDFGRMGGEPSHPELLDALVGWFVANGESIKALHRLILTSETWKQSSKPDPERAKVDADNRLLWRANPFRLDVESFRDALLSVSGRLDPTMGGPGDRAFRFKDDHSPVYDYAGADPEASRRRGVYRFAVRSVPDPFYEALDGADPSILTPRRNVTLTALQALAAWNDAFVLRQCEHLAARAGSVAEAARLAWGRDLRPDEASRFEAYAARHGLAAACRVLVNANEFVFVE
jgi:hypothetical protein